MRVWVDMTASAHVLVFRPLIRLLESQGHEVEVTARDFAQTLELCERHGIDAEPIGRHRGGRLASKGTGLVSRSSALARWARGRRFDVAIGHGSNDVTVAARPLAVVRTPPAVSLYPRFENPLFGQVLDRLRGAQAVVLPRTPEQRAELDGFIVPEHAVDAQSLVAFADLVISAGGTMNREAVALETPVWTTFEGRMGAVDEALIGAGRLRRLTRAEDVVLEKRADSGAERTRRDPDRLTDLLLAPLD